MIGPPVIDTEPEQVHRSTHLYVNRFEPGTGQYCTPESLFICIPTTDTARRFVNRYNMTEMLIYTDGSRKHSDGESDAAAGWGFVFSDQPSGTIFGRLENKGPYQDTYSQTINRAELRAVIAALQYRDWFSEGFSKVVIATDSEMLVNSAARWVQTWAANDWSSNSDSSIVNRDLWELFLDEVARYEINEVEINFWRVAREHATLADAAARQGATLPSIEKFVWVRSD